MRRTPLRAGVGSGRPVSGAPLSLVLLLLAGCAGVGVQRDLDRGERLLAAGQLEAAARAYESYLVGGPGVESADLALFRLALIRLLPDSPLADPEVGRALLERLVSTHPGSPFAASAELILALHRDNRALQAELGRLRAQLQELRRIDLDPPPR